jgi:hypothetical protein
MHPTSSAANVRDEAEAEAEGFFDDPPSTRISATASAAASRNPPAANA